MDAMATDQLRPWHSSDAQLSNSPYEIVFGPSEAGESAIFSGEQPAVLIYAQSACR